MIELAFIFVVICLLARPVGIYIAMVYSGRRTILSPILQPIEKIFYRFIKTDAQQETNWWGYTVSLLLFSAFGFCLLYGVLILQGSLPLNPDMRENISPHLAFNIAISFITNTNWQSYIGEKTLSHFSQTFGLGVQQFLSCAVGMAVAATFTRSFARRNSREVGNFWVDLTRGVLYILLPLAIIYAILLVFAGVPHIYAPAVNVVTLEGAAQTIDRGPIASMIAIKQLGTNGGGFMGVNAAHPFENPNAFTNVLHLIFMLLLPVAWVYAFAILCGHNRSAMTLYVAILIIVLPLFAISIIYENEIHPEVAALGVDNSVGNMEGKETRFGALNSAAWGVAATITGNGSANSAYGSFMPLSTTAMMLPMMLGEITFGGVGSGVISLMMFVLMTVFIGGLMVGRTPELFGKKIGVYEIKLASLMFVIPATIILVGTAIALMLPSGRLGVLGHGIHGYREILYAFSSAVANNGSAMAGIKADSSFYNTILGIAMLLGRYFILITALALAGALANKQTVPLTSGTLPVRGSLFIIMLLIVIVLVGVLNYVPALAVGAFNNIS